MNPITGTSPRQRLEQYRHGVAVFVAVATLAATIGGWTPNAAAAWTIAIVAIVVGVPHGALDVEIGPRLTKPTWFFGMYLAGACCIVLAWLAAPEIGVVAFFISSWYHFARGDSVHHRDLACVGDLLGVSTAGCAIGLPLALHAGIVTPLLSSLLFGTAALTIDRVALFGWIIAAPSLVAGLVAGFAAFRARQCSAVVELATIALVAAAVHPLVSFAMYFALWHAPRHLITLDIDRHAWWRALWATVATMLAGVGAWWFVEPAAPAARVVFIGLAAFTGPHLVLTELLRSQPASRLGQGANRRPLSTVEPCPCVPLSTSVQNTGDRSSQTMATMVNRRQMSRTESQFLSDRATLS